MYKRQGFGGESCGDANDNGGISASDALLALKASVGSGLCLHCVCDADSNGNLVASDAFAILRNAVGTNPNLNCPTCYVGDE